MLRVVKGKCQTWAGTNRRRGSVLYWVEDFFGWIGISFSRVSEVLASTAATGSDSLSLLGILCSGLADDPLAATSWGVFSTGPASVAGFEAYWTLRS
jgi:hypothetical protein